MYWCLLTHWEFLILYNCVYCLVFLFIWYLVHFSASFNQAKPQMTLFTGSSRVAEKLAVDLKGRIKLEDAGFDWKILGPDVQEVCQQLKPQRAFPTVKPLNVKLF